MKSQFHGIYIRPGSSCDRIGQRGVNYGMTGIFTNPPSMFTATKLNGRVWTFVPHGSDRRFIVFAEDVYNPESFAEQ